VPVLGGPYEFDSNAAAVRPVRRARLATPWKIGDENLVVVVDADRDEFACVPGLPAGQWEMQALAADGTRLLLRIWSQGLCLHTLATGQQRWFPPADDGDHHVAGLSPDGRTIATLCLPDDPQGTVRDATLSAVNLIDITTGRCRRLWATPGAWSAESSVSWSPDGQLIAVTHTVPVDEGDGQYDWLTWMTTVLDLAGTPIWQCLHAAIPTASNAAWAGDRQLLVAIEEPLHTPLVNVDMRDGIRHEIGELSAYPPLAVVDDRVVTIARPDEDQPPHWVYITTRFDGSDPQPLLTVASTSDGSPTGDIELARLRPTAVDTDFSS
jgi:dipeptidyl aminopeptidase/acylaminoacyl peptidase